MAGPDILRREGAAEEPALKDRALSATAEGIAIADARLPDNPLIYVNSGFERLTGYSAQEVLGRNCRFLQGAGTDPEALEKLRAALRARREVTVLLFNYRKDGTGFWNRLAVTPVCDAAGEVTHFIGVQSDVTEETNIREALKSANRELETAYRALRTDLEAAARVQQTFLPSTLPETAGVRFASLYRPCADLAGDMFNVLPLGGGRLAVYILDVSGHGVASALLSVTLTRFLSAGEIDLGRPADTARALNRKFAWDPRTAQYFSLLCGILDTGTGEFRYTCAGHCDPVLLAVDAEPAVIAGGGPPVGLFPNAQFPESTLHLRPGDRLYLYTDGLIEPDNAQGREFGLDRLVAVLHRERGESLETGLARLLGEVVAWNGSPALADDVSLLALEMT